MKIKGIMGKDRVPKKFECTITITEPFHLTKYIPYIEKLLIGTTIKMKWKKGKTPNLPHCGNHYCMVSEVTIGRSAVQPGVRGEARGGLFPRPADPDSIYASDAKQNM